MTTNRSSLVRTSLALVPVQVFSRAGEAAMPLLLAAWFGRSEQTDLYFFAWALFALAGSLVFSAYQDSALVPILSDVRQTDPRELPAVLSSLLSHTLVIGVSASLLIGLSASAYFVLAYPKGLHTVAIEMVPFFCAYLVLLSLRTFFFAVLHSEHRFFVTPFASAAGMATTLSFLFVLHAKIGVVAIPMASTLGELVAACIGYRLLSSVLGGNLTFTMRRPAAVMRFARLIASEVAGSAVTRVNPVVDQMMASFAGVAGGGTILRYTFDVASLPTSLLQATLLPVLLSHLSDDVSRDDLPRFRRTVGRTVFFVVATMSALSALLFLLREPLLVLLFRHGQMDATAVSRMARVLPYHLIGLPAFGALLALARAHVALRNSGIMVGMGLFNAGLNVTFNFVLLRTMGLEGLALSTSCVSAAVAVVFYALLVKKVRSLAAS